MPKFNPMTPKLVAHIESEGEDFGEQMVPMKMLEGNEISFSFDIGGENMIASFDFSQVQIAMNKMIQAVNARAQEEVKARQES